RVIDHNRLVVPDCWNLGKFLLGIEEAPLRTAMHTFGEHHHRNDKMLPALQHLEAHRSLLQVEGDVEEWRDGGRGLVRDEPTRPPRLDLYGHVDLSKQNDGGSELNRAPVVG